MNREELQKTFAALTQHTRSSRLSSSTPSKTKRLHKTPAKGEGQGYATSSTIEALLADESSKQRQRKKKWIYCEGEHWSDKCLRYSNMP